MSGTDERLTPVEQHLGDRLAALVDGELGDDARDRVLSHLATCWSCKAEADAQRRLKNVFADTAPPPPSDGLLARLQGLPASGDPAAPSGPDGPGGGPGDGGTAAREALGLGPARSPLKFDYLSPARGAGALLPEGGFRIHREQETDRSASRGRRFAFAAASAFSLAALALGGAVNSGSLNGSVVSGGERSGSAAAPDRTASAAAERDARRRSTAGGDRTGGAPGAAAPSAQATTSVQTQLERGAGVAGAGSGTHPLLADASAFTPSLIRPPALPQLLPADKRLPLGAIPGRAPRATAPPGPTPAAAAGTARP